MPQNNCFVESFGGCCIWQDPSGRQLFSLFCGIEPKRECEFLHPCVFSHTLPCVNFCTDAFFYTLYRVPKKVPQNPKLTVTSGDPGLEKVPFLQLVEDLPQGDVLSSCKGVSVGIRGPTEVMSRNGYVRFLTLGHWLHRATSGLCQIPATLPKSDKFRYSGKVAKIATSVGIMNNFVASGGYSLCIMSKIAKADIIHYSDSGKVAKIAKIDGNIIANVVVSLRGFPRLPGHVIYVDCHVCDSMYFSTTFSYKCCRKYVPTLAMVLIQLLHHSQLRGYCKNSLLSHVDLPKIVKQPTINCSTIIRFCSAIIKLGRLRSLWIPATLPKTTKFSVYGERAVDTNLVSTLFVAWTLTDVSNISPNIINIASVFGFPKTHPSAPRRADGVIGNSIASGDFPLWIMGNVAKADFTHYDDSGKVAKICKPLEENLPQVVVQCTTTISYKSWPSCTGHVGNTG